MSLRVIGARQPHLSIACIYGDIFCSGQSQLYYINCNVIIPGAYGSQRKGGRSNTQPQRYSMTSGHLRQESPGRAMADLLGTLAASPGPLTVLCNLRDSQSDG